MTRERWRMVQGTAVLVAALVLQASPGEARMVTVAPACGVCSVLYFCPTEETADIWCDDLCHGMVAVRPHVCDDNQYGCEPGQYWTTNWWCVES